MISKEEDVRALWAPISRVEMGKTLDYAREELVDALRDVPELKYQSKGELYFFLERLGSPNKISCTLLGCLQSIMPGEYCISVSRGFFDGKTTRVWGMSFSTPVGCRRGN